MWPMPLLSASCHVLYVFERAISQPETRLSPTNRATHLCKCNGVADPLKHAITITIKKTCIAHLPMCYHIEFGRSTSHVYALVGENPQNWGALGSCFLRGGVTDP